MTTNKANWQSKSFLTLFALLFLVAPFYNQSNIGGSGLELTYNAPVWATASWIIAFALYLMMSRCQFIYPKYYPCLLLFPLTVIIGSLLAEISQPITWLFRQLYLLGGLFFLFALFQFRPKQQQIERALYLIVIAALLHALVGALQANSPGLLGSWFPNNRDNAPRGIFQQINVQVTFLTTGLIISLYLISRPAFHTASLVTKSLLLTSLAFSSYIIVASGSRVGLISTVLGLLLLLASRKKQLLKQKKILAIVILVITAGTYLGQAGLSRTMDKTARMAEDSISSARINMYTIGLELTAQKPVQGHGVGSFLRVWNQQTADYLQRHPEAAIPQYITHPHNELLFWMIEGGIASLLAILVFSIGIFISLYQCGLQRGGAYAAMLLPISLHTQFELPFYISSVHWFLWLFLLYLPLSHFTHTATISLSHSVTRLTLIIAFVIALGTTWFMVNSARAQADVYSFLYNKNSQPPYLKIALGNLYFKPLAEQLAMRSMLYASIKNNDKEKVKTFIDWAEDYTKLSPELKMYEDLISAYTFIEPEKRGCGAISSALKMYPQNKALQKANKNCPVINALPHRYPGLPR